VLVLVSKSDYTTRRANGMISMGFCGELQEPEFELPGVNFYQGKRNLVRVSGGFELSEFELTK